MLYLELPAADYLQSQKAINLVLDQHQRMKDLFFNIRIMSSCAFVTERAAFKGLKHVQRIKVPNTVKGGGTPSCPTFYLNPQVQFSFDKSKVPNPGAVEKIDTLITYQSDNVADVKLFLLLADTKDRVANVSDAKLIDAA